MSSGLLFLAPALACQHCRCTGGHQVKQATPSGTLQTWSRPSDYFAAALLSRILHAPGLALGHLPNSMHLRPSASYLRLRRFSPKPSRHGHCVPTAVPQLPLYICSPTLALLPTDSHPPAPRHVEVMGFGPRTHKTLLTPLVTFPTALTHLRTLCALGLVPAGGVSLSPVHLLTSLSFPVSWRACFLPNNCEAALA